MDDIKDLYMMAISAIIYMYIVGAGLLLLVFMLHVYSVGLELVLLITGAGTFLLTLMSGTYVTKMQRMVLGDKIVEVDESKYDNLFNEDVLEDEQNNK